MKNQENERNRGDTRKSEKLYHGITHLRDEIVEEAGNPARKEALSSTRCARRYSPWLRWGALAACLCAAVIGLWALRGFDASSGQEGGGNSMANGTAQFLAAEAVYPTMAAYPEEDKYLTPTGELKDEFNDDYHAWWEDVRARRDQPEAHSAGLDAFLQKSVRQFLSGAGDRNRVYSPLNVYLALGMLAEVTGGESRAQILDLLGADSMEALREQASAVWNTSYRDDGVTKSVLASSLWLDDDFPYTQSTLNTLAETYYASTYQGDMGTEAYNQALRDWLNTQTGGLLSDQAAGLALDPEAVLALATTIYFRAKWSNEFYEGNTSSETFHAPSGDMACDFMHQEGSRDYFWGDRFSSVSQRLENGGAMWFLLPDGGSTPEDLLNDTEALSFISGAWGTWENQKDMMVSLSVPKFDVSSEQNLLPGLAALGVTDVQDWERADFSSLTPQPNGLILSQASHAARAAIDEEGCTAAAYTVMTTDGAGMPMGETIDFTLDRPFLFVITGSNGLPLFTGIVNQPVQ